VSHCVKKKKKLSKSWPKRKIVVKKLSKKKKKVVRKLSKSFQKGVKKLQKVVEGKNCLQGRMVAYDLAIPPFEGQKIRTDGAYTSLGIGEKPSDLKRYNMEDFVIDDTIY
jgi:signal recognition particle GTPase